MIDVLFVVRGGHIDAASSKYRVFQYLKYLSLNSISYRVIIPPPRKLVQCYLWIPWMIRLFLFGIFSKRVFIQKDIYCVSIWSFFKYFGKRIIYDFDDAVFVENDAGGKAVYSFPFVWKTCKYLVGEMLQVSDLVIVANGYLENFAKKIAHRTLMIPMSLSLSEFQTKDHGDVEVVVIGWIGSFQTSPYLSLIQDALRRIVNTYGKRVEIRIVTNSQVVLQDVEFQQVSWELVNEINNIHSFDIGIVPLPENPFTLGKSSFKLLQFMACGLPTVSSAVGFNTEVVIDGENGFLAQETEAWVYKLGRLIEDAGLRKRMGAAARKAVETRYSLEVNSVIFCQAILTA